ncbi:hypothetical protein BCR44DRAFT_127115 [Catenaria anguillulae PL171]|uniref:Basal body-orientation factor 1 n=1 Tax=Catenaria anguillulae PL171 TaxID=765915 RepID=A0A1Y2HXR6_9FUNG|nr:hypothetical protein BCR44DRAFT_127115 [Catenaria anguillulae PL171]
MRGTGTTTPAPASTPGATAPAPAPDAPGSARIGNRRKSILSPLPMRPLGDVGKGQGAKGGMMASGSRAALGIMTSVGEKALETTLDSTSKALAMYKERLSNLIQANAELQQQCQEQEKDAIEVMGALRDQMDRKDREIIALRSTIDANHAQTEHDKQEIHNSYARKIEELGGIILDKESSIRLMEQEVAAVKDFKKKRAELMKEIESQKTQMTEMERRFKESMVRMERKFFEEKVRMQKETNRRISELAAKAHQEAVAALDETTKDMYRENVRLVEALKSHMSATEELTKQNSRLSAHNMQLVQEKEMNDLIVRDKIISAKNQNQLIRDLESKVVTLEQTLSHVVREFEVEREILRKKAHQELDDIKRIAAQLKLNLDRKAQEMRHIKRLALHLVDQRTDVEKFFMDALDHVRRQIAAERANERKQRIDHYTQLARQALDGNRPNGGGGLKRQNGPRPASRASVAFANDGRPQSASASASPPSATAEPMADGQQVKVSDLSWTDKERVLRVLFARMNGLIKDDEKERTGAGRTAATEAQMKRELLGGSRDSSDGSMSGGVRDSDDVFGREDGDEADWVDQDEFPAGRTIEDDEIGSRDTPANGEVSVAGVRDFSSGEGLNKGIDQHPQPGAAPPASSPPPPLAVPTIIVPDIIEGDEDEGAGGQ